MGFLPDRSEVVVRHLLERKASEIPDKECLLFEDGEIWTYRDMLHEAYGAANALSHIGIKRGENVLIFLPNGQNWIRAWCGVNFLGAVIVPINVSFRGEILRHICRDSLAKHIITSPELSHRLKGFGLNLNVIDSAGLKQGSAKEPKLDAPIEPWDLHMILYTSGTTGPSKGVMATYFKSYTGSQLCFGAKATAEDTALVDLPLYHFSGMSCIYGLWTQGGRSVIRTVFSTGRYWDIIRKYGVTMSIMVGSIPSFMEKSPPQENDADNPLRYVIVSPMVEDPPGFMARFGIEELVQGYGMTEVDGVFMTQGPILNPKTCGKVTIWEVRLVDEHDIPVPTGGIGELIVRSELPWSMNSGYWRNPEATTLAWRNGWFHTGDLFTRDEEGNFFFVDRRKDTLRRRGENISSFEIEREVLSYPDVLDVACVGVPGETEEEVKIFVIPREGSQIDSEALTRFLIPRLPYFMVPRFVEVVDAFPTTPTNRIMKYKLRDQGNSAATWDREAAGIRVTRDS